MKLFAKIRLKLGQRSLKKRIALVKRQKKAHNFNSAKTAGLVFEANHSDGFRHVREFQKYLKSLNIVSHIITYVPLKEIPAEFILWDDCQFFCQKDLDFLFRPKPEIINDFMERKIDMLIDLSLNPHFPVHYINGLSTASFKVGRYTEDENYYDFMINTTKNESIEYLIEHIKHYLTLLNNPSSKFIKQN